MFKPGRGRATASRKRLGRRAGGGEGLGRRRAADRLPGRERSGVGARAARVRPASPHAGRRRALRRRSARASRGAKPPRASRQDPRLAPNEDPLSGRANEGAAPVPGRRDRAWPGAIVGPRPSRPPCREPRRRRRSGGSLAAAPFEPRSPTTALSRCPDIRTPEVGTSEKAGRTGGTAADAGATDETVAARCQVGLSPARAITLPSSREGACPNRFRTSDSDAKLP